MLDNESKILLFLGITPDMSEEEIKKAGENFRNQIRLLCLTVCKRDTITSIDLVKMQCQINSGGYQ